MSVAVIDTRSALAQRVVERLAFPVVFLAAVGFHAMSMARGWSPEATVGGAVPVTNVTPSSWAWRR